MFQKIIDFIKYHNAFAIGFMIVFVGFGLSLAASPELRENLQEALISSQEVVQSIDNSYVLAVNLDDFDFGLQIKEITEDEKNYYITYVFKTIAIQDYVWQEVEKEKTLTVSKEALGPRDLGLYIAEELGEVIDYELAYLKEFQKSEKEKGLSQKIVTVQYAGLIGRFLNPEEKVFPGYELVVLPPQPEFQAELQAELQAEPQFEPAATPSAEPLLEATSTVATSTPIEEVISEASTTEPELTSASTSTEPTTATSTVIEDSAAPVITLVGDASVNLTVGDTYVDAGATASDDVDRDVSARIAVVNSVDTSIAGTYTVTYNVSDAAGNVATEVIRTVNVLEVVAPQPEPEPEPQPEVVPEPQPEPAPAPAE